MRDLIKKVLNEAKKPLVGCDFFEDHTSDHRWCKYAENKLMKNEITRDEFMSFFRNDDSLNQLSPHDRVEVFRTIMLGSSDFKKDIIRRAVFFARYTNKVANPGLTPHLDNYEPGTGHALTFTYVLDHSINWDICIQSQCGHIDKNEIVIFSVAGFGKMENGLFLFSIIPVIFEIEMFIA